VESKPESDVSRLLRGWRAGDSGAFDALVPLVYKELRRLARNELRKERRDHTLQSAALVHEAYVRMVGLNSPQWESRAHFFAIAAQVMRQVLVDYARRHRASKRGGSVFKMSIEEAVLVPKKADVDVVALDHALQKLARIDARQSRVVELRFFGGMSLAEISEALQISTATAQRDWMTARAWLHREMSRESL
jgi:RNA polymerase sigma factor (TIGR02999 family)